MNLLRAVDAILRASLSICVIGLYSCMNKSILMHKSLVSDTGLSVNLYGSGDPVLFISGLGGRGEFWSSLVPCFSSKFLVVLHDHRGCGNSMRSLISYSIDQMANDVLSLMKELSIERASIVGHSTGGAIGQLLAARFPKKVRKLVLSSTWPGPSEYFTELFKLRLDILKNNGPEVYMRDGILRGYPPSFLSKYSNTIIGNTKARLKFFSGTEIETSRINAVMEHDIRSELKNITSDTLVVCAKDDQITPAEFSDELELAIPGAQKVIFPYGGHFTPHTIADEFNGLVSDFLKA